MSAIQNQLQKAINLAKKTGDKIIVFDSANSNDAYAVMSLDEYEKLIDGAGGARGLTEEELLDKINRDVAIWKSGDESSESDESEVGKEGSVNEKMMENFYLSADKQNSPHFKKERRNENNKKRNNWSIPSERKKTEEEIIEEDRQYLEEVKF
jgi:hypothetical protein